MTDLFYQYLRPELLVPAAFAWLIERAKQAKWIGWITPESTDSLKRFISGLMAVLGAVGISASYDAGTLTIIGLLPANIASMGLLIVQNYLVQHVTFHGALKEPKP